MIKKLFVTIVCFLVSIIILCIYSNTILLIQNQIKIVILAENKQNLTMERNAKGNNGSETSDNMVIKKLSDQTSLSLHRINDSSLGTVNLTDLIRLYGFAGIPDFYSPSHPFNKPHFLKSFIGHVYRKILLEDKTKLRSESEKNIKMNFSAYERLLYEKADRNKTVILATIDLAYVDMAINLYETSFKKFNITNYVFACSQPGATNILMSNRIDAITLWNDSQGHETSDYSTKAFNRKTRYKTLATILALSMGFTVLLMDVDIVFLKNPFPFLTCNSCDIIFQSEGGEKNRNTGFYLSFPTNNTIKMPLLALDSYKLSETFNDQDSINYIADVMQADDNLQIKVLNQTLFPNGVRYFEDGCRMFGDDNLCQDCVIIHNNDIISYSNKVYRFKEHFMWVTDRNGYYSNENAKYLTFENTLGFSAGTPEAEIQNLKTAFLIGHILKRIVILPKFHCPNNVLEKCPSFGHYAGCPAFMYLNMTSLDMEFGDNYREQVFLRNLKVPKSVKDSVSDLILVNTPAVYNTFKSGDLKKVGHMYNVADPIRGASPEEFARWMEKHAQYSVLRFHSLYGNVIDNAEFLIFNYKLTKLHQ